MERCRVTVGLQGMGSLPLHHARGVNAAAILQAVRSRQRGPSGHSAPTRRRGVPHGCEVRRCPDEGAA
jgi:hypothetical protein